MPEELLRSSLFASFRKYILSKAGFQIATMKSVQKEAKALAGETEIPLFI